MSRTGAGPLLRHWLPAAVAAGAALLAATCASEAAALIERLYVFGDSYSDSGNAYALIGAPKSPPYDFRFSNGPTAVEYMARTFGLALHFSEDRTIAADSSVNFAVGGAWTSRKNTDAPLDGKTGLLNQIESFEQRVGSGKTRFDSQRSLFFIAIGTNDLLFGTLGGQDRGSLVSNALHNIEAAVRALHAAGARHIAVASIPSLHNTPRAAGLPAAQSTALREAVLALNQGSGQVAARLRTELKSDVFTLSWGQYYDDLMANPAAFGIASAGTCMTHGSLCADPQRYVFFDQLHPTTAAHKVVGIRLATHSESRFVCPPSAPGSASTPPACRFVATERGEPAIEAAPNAGASKTASGAATGGRSCTRVAFRQTADLCNNCTAPPWNGEVIGSDSDWTMTYLDGRNNSGRARWQLRTKEGEQLVFYDDKRNIYTFFDLGKRKQFQRRGEGATWSGVGDILATDCR